ncbi:DUF6261 family protein [Chryseobacterium indoltheticum]|uniref:Uncharacterized protein n=1 Tax=Chryseobacterium indoltheticum TaxID=254 RepID=A0A381FJD4_9FLAO|nr:DUF6261 family protein [Chryseobacterium indoltheticum]SUX46282.1 Uncharacterised protein [Chryseobacterium indoltheticum]
MIKNLISLDASKLHHAEFGQLIVRFSEDFSKTSLDTGTDADFKRMYDALQAKIPDYNSALDQIRASEESQKIAKADHVRDADVQALKDSVRPYRNSRTQAEKDAYTAIKILLDQYKGVENTSYEEETNKLNSLVSRLQSSEYSSHVTMLGIIKFINELAASNIAFNDLFAHRSFQSSQKQTYDVKALRKDLNNDYRQLVNYITILADVKTDTFYKDVLAVINNGRSYYANVMLARRNSRKDDDK